MGLAAATRKAIAGTQAYLADGSPLVGISAQTQRLVDEIGGLRTLVDSIESD
jgi:hypothetical protein